LPALIRKHFENIRKKFAVPEIPEVSAGTNAGISDKFTSFPAFQNKNYRYFFAGQFISVIGTWMQIVAQGWLVLQLTQSALYLGLIAALATTPSLLFSLFGGVVVDRFNKKTILFCTQAANMILALSLGIVTVLNIVTLPMIGVAAFLMGTVNAVDAPARQAFVSTIVNRDQLASAIAMNSGIFNAARAVGPAVSGLLIASVGSGMAFILNGVSYLALMIALNFITYSEKLNVEGVKPFQAIRNGIQYSFSHPLIRILLVFTAVLSVFGWSYSTLMPLIATSIYNLEAQGLGYMYTATGLGSVLATYLVGAHSRKVSRLVFILGGNMLFSVSLMLFSFGPPLSVALVLLFFMGMGLLSQAATMNTVIQTVVKNEYRGRVMSIYVLMFLGVAPFGNFEVGFLSENLSITVALFFNGAMVLLAGLIIFIHRKEIRNAYRSYNQNNEILSSG
jgi:MFS family permease